MSIRILAIGKKHESWVVGGIRRYEVRLKRPFDVQWELLPHSSREGDVARQEESKRILTRLTPQDWVMLLDERGSLLDSPAVSKTLLQPLQASEKVCVIIGGAYGVDDALMNRANLIWSLSPLVFPHQLVRLMVIEQLYRAQEIRDGKPYHHE